MEKFKDSAVIIALVTSFLYCIGAARDQGFIRAVNLNTEMMAKDFQLVIFEGFILLINNWLVPIFILLILFVIPYFVITWISKKLERSKDQDGNYRKGTDEFLPDQRWHSYLAIPIWGVSIFIFFAFFIVSFHKEGRGEGDQLVAKIKEGSMKEGRLIRVKIELDVKELIFIACGSNNCAGIELSSNRVFYFPQSNGYSYAYIP